MQKILLATSLALLMSSGCLYASDYETTYGGNDIGYNAYVNSRGEIYGDENSYRNSSGMIINR